MKNKLLLLLPLFLLFGFQVKADTITVRTHNAAHMNWNGNYDRWAVFPASQPYRKITLKYTLGCPAGGCSDWDYTTRVYIRKHTGQMDSTMVSSPNFTVNGTASDSLHYATSQTYTYFYNTNTNSADSTANPALTLILYANSQQPTVATDTFTVWSAGYYNTVYNPTGQVTGYIYVTPTASIYQQPWVSYTVFEVIDDFEIGRVITPYANGFGSAWKWEYQIDVTDFALLLHDSVEVRVFYDGWSDGFTATLDFEMIEGTPPRFAYDIKNLWNGYYTYGYASNPIENHLAPKTVLIDSAAAGVGLRILQTGHGFGGTQNCAEFCQKNNKVKVNNTVRYTNLIWRDNCGLNPLFPQPGTWLYDRANWCPGDKVDPFVHDLTPFVTPGQAATLDVDMDPYTNTSTSQPAGYSFGSQLFFYQAPNFTTDAEVADILAPSKNKAYGRLNPICNKPRILVRNTGSNALTSLTITYGVTGGTPQTYSWTGNLPFLASAIIELDPINLTSSGANGEFYATVSNPNGQADQYADNNTMHSEFLLPEVLPADMILLIQTNNRGYETTYELVDDQENVIVSGTSLLNLTEYADTLHLPIGCYQFRIFDSAKDGLNFFANPQAGNGFVRFTLPNGAPYKNFTSNFGTSIIYNFRVISPSATENPLAGNNWLQVYPNPASGFVNLNFAEAPGKTNVVMYDVMGRKVYTTILSGEKPNTQLNVSGLTPGVYSLLVENQGKQITRLLVIQ